MAPAKKNTDEAEAPERIPASDPDFQAQVVDLRDEQEMKWSEVAEALGCQQGKAMMAYLLATIPAKERIKFKDDDDLAEKVVAARDDDNQSWGYIAARAGVAESKIRKLYTEQTGNTTRGLRIGKGGRYPDGEKPEKAPAAKKSSASKAAPAKATAAKKAARGKVVPLGEMDLAQLKERLNGKSISVDRDGRMERIAVKTINKLDDGEITLSDKQGKSRVVNVSDIKKATR